jgi:beta-lactam-binding protein with PASTA domain
MIEPGTAIDGRYEVVSRIGSGGMADVYLARDRLLGRQVAVKLLQHRFAEDQEFVERFRREASSAAGLSHPNVVAVFDRGEWDGTYYIAMEYLPGKSLKSIVREQGPLQSADAIEIVVQILRAARFAHKRGIIHRDLKPHNVILDEEGRAKVTDFGIARAGASDMTLTGSIMGTAQYLSPEQAQGHTVSETSDLYAVGIVLYELLTGRVPFDGETAVTIALKQVSAEPPRPSLLNPAVSPELDAVVARALAKDPAERFENAGEFIAALERARPDAGVGAGASAGVGSLSAAAPGSGAPTAAAGAAGGPPNGRPADGPLPGALLLAAAGESEGEPDPVQEAKRRRRRWWWASGAGALILVAAVVAAVLLLHTNEVTVPSVAGQSQAAAVLRLQRAGLTPIVGQASSASVPAGAVVSQSPRAGSEVKRGSRVSIVISNGPESLAMPKVVGLSGTAALAKLRAAGLQPTTQSQPSAKIAAGTVISTVPSAGTDLQKGSGVVVVLSSGPQQVSVPEVTGETQAEAKAALAAAGLKLGTVTHQTAPAGQSAGAVLSQSPVAGTQLQTGQPVSLVVAQAPREVSVPQVVGQSETQAAATLGRAGFNPKSVSRGVSESEASKVGVVLRQSPAGGRLAPKGATVTIAVGVLEPPPSTSSTSTTTQSSTSTTTTASVSTSTSTTAAGVNAAAP